MGPPRTVGPTGCTASSSDVTTPKFPPPPRNAQNNSGFSSTAARTTWPSALTSSAEMRLSQLRPCLRTKCPIPPPSVNPPSPVDETSPPVVAKPKSWVSRSSCFQVVPPCALARPARASTCTARIWDRSMTRPSSQVENPARLWAPPRTAIGSPSLLAKRTATTTSAVPVHRTIIAGYRSIAWFHVRRALS
jgi:hypothetical protein